MRAAGKDGKKDGAHCSVFLLIKLKYAPCTRIYGNRNMLAEVFDGAHGFVAQHTVGAGIFFMDVRP